MLCTIYRLRQHGHKLTADEVTKTECIADLEYQRHPAGQPVMRATISTGNHVVMWQDIAEVRIKGQGFFVKFQENIDHTHATQVWWCVPLAQGEPSAADRIYKQLRSSV